MSEHRQQIAIQHWLLMMRATGYKFVSDRAREYSSEGFGRRLDLLLRAIGSVFKALPPDLEGLPARGAVVDATMAIQAFVINVVGCLDNLAWVWVFETGLWGPDGEKIDKKEVALWKRNTAVRGSLPQELRDHLQTKETWFGYIRGFRDALAHRISLYVPPSMIFDSVAEEYDRLERLAGEAPDGETYERVKSEQNKLGVFRPWIVHSVREGSPYAIFHQQMLIDYDNVAAIARKIFRALEKRPLDVRH